MMVKTLTNLLRIINPLSLAAGNAIMNLKTVPIVLGDSNLAA
jgi:hypothetical protein